MSLQRCSTTAAYPPLARYLPFFIVVFEALEPPIKEVPIRKLPEISFKFRASIIQILDLSSLVLLIVDHYLREPFAEDD